MNYEKRDTAHLTFHKCCLLRRTILILRYTYELYECTTSKHSHIITRKTLYDNPYLQFSSNTIHLIMTKNNTQIINQRFATSRISTIAI